MPDHVFEANTVVEVVEYDANSALVFAHNLHATVLDTIVIHDECANLNCRKKAERDSKEVLHACFANHLKLQVICHRWLLIVRLIDDLEVGNYQCAD